MDGSRREITRGSKLTAGLCTIALLSGLVAGSARAAAAPRTCNGNPAARVNMGHGWWSIASPTFPKVLGRRQSGTYIPSPTDPVGSAQRFQDFYVPKEFDPPMEGFTASRSDPDVFYATDADALMRSSDAGCSWQLMLSLGDSVGRDSARVPVPRNNLLKEARSPELTNGPQIADIWSLDDGKGGEYLYLVTTASSGNLMLSRDGGKTWDTGSDPSAPRSLMHPKNARVAPSDPNVIYSGEGLSYESSTPGVPLVDSQQRTIWITYRSTDGGQTWSIPGCPATSGQRLPTDAQSACETAKIDAMKKDESFQAETNGTKFTFAIDPLDPDVVWQTGDARLRQSVDGGKTWTEIKTAKAQTGRNPFELVVDHQPGRPARLLGLVSRQYDVTTNPTTGQPERDRTPNVFSRMVILSLNGGDSWKQVPWPDGRDYWSPGYPDGGWGFFGPRSHQPIVGFNPMQGNGEAGYPFLYRIDLRMLGRRDPWVPLPYVFIGKNGLPPNTSEYDQLSGAFGTHAEMTPFGFFMCYCVDGEGDQTREILTISGRI